MASTPPSRRRGPSASEASTSVEGDEERAVYMAERDADVAHPAGPVRERLRLVVGRPNSFTSRAPDTLNRSVMVCVHLRR